MENFIRFLLMGRRTITEFKFLLNWRVVDLLILKTTDPHSVMMMIII